MVMVLNKIFFGILWKIQFSNLLSSMGHFSGLACGPHGHSHESGVGMGKTIAQSWGSKQVHPERGSDSPH